MRKVWGTVAGMTRQPEAHVPDHPPTQLPTADLLSAITDAVRPIGAALSKIGEAALNLLPLLRATVNDPVYVAGLEAQFYVRAAFDPEYAVQEDVHRLVLRDLPPFLTPDNRAAVLAAALTGWCEHHDGCEPLMPWHRLIGSTALEVSRG